jgi:malonyl-CoA O-methyltransferase
MTATLPDAHAVAHQLERQARVQQPPWLHGEVARRMAERLAVIRATPSAVLDWWGHLGASADALATAYPKARRIVVEPMPALAQRSAAAAASPWWSPRRWTGRKAEVVLEADVPAAAAQLLWANMMLHAAPDPPALMARWRRALSVDGFLMFSCFGPDTLAELRAVYRAAGWQAPAIEFTDMHDIGDALVHAGFADPVMDQEHLTLTWATPGALLDELRILGANTHAARFAGLRTPRWRGRLEDALRSRLAGADGRPSLSFEIVYGHAFNPAPRARVAERTEVSLDAMRAMVKSGRGSF